MATLSTGPCLEGVVRLLVEDGTEFYLSQNELEDFYFIKDQLARGRMEVCTDGQFITVCNNPWTNMEASVVCSQLGFSQYGE